MQTVPPGGPATEAELITQNDCKYLQYSPYPLQGGKADFLFIYLFFLITNVLIMNNAITNVPLALPRGLQKDPLQSLGGGDRKSCQPGMHNIATIRYWS